jgi:hypothetical protein
VSRAKSGAPTKALDHHGTFFANRTLKDFHLINIEAVTFKNGEFFSGSVFPSRSLCALLPGKERS